MTIKVKNLLLSLLYIPLVIIGQFIGNILGVFLLSILGKEYWFSFILNYLSEIAFMLIGGIIGGIFAGYTIIKFFKSIEFQYIIIIPWFVSIIYIAFIFFIAPKYIELDIVALGDAAAVLLSILFFHYYLKRNKPTNL